MHAYMIVLFFYLFDVRPEIVHLTCNDAGNISRPQLLLHLLPLLSLPPLDVVTGTSAHQLQRGKKNEKKKQKQPYID